MSNSASPWEKILLRDFFNFWILGNSVTIFGKNGFFMYLGCIFPLTKYKALLFFRAMRAVKQCTQIQKLASIGLPIAIGIVKSRSWSSIYESSFNPIQDKVWSKRFLPTIVSYLSSTNVGISPSKFETFKLNRFVTMLWYFNAIICTSPEFLNPRISL